MSNDHQNFRGVPPESEEGWQRIHLTQHEWTEVRDPLKELAKFWPDARNTLKGIVIIVRFAGIALKLWPWALLLGTGIAILSRFPEIVP